MPHMWVARFQIKHDNCWISPKTKKYNITVKGIPLNAYQEGGRWFHSNIIFLSGDSQHQRKFIEALKKDHSIKKIDVKGNQIFSLVEGTDMISVHFDKSFFFITPVIMKDGYEYWELGSWSRKKLMVFYQAVKKFAFIKILKLKKEFPSVFIQQAIPKLTLKQREAFELAQASGYYEYPRKISLQELAHNSNMSRTTLQSHLRKAEKKILRIHLE